MQGVQTIGNATLIAYDGNPVLSTDPWMGGDHYAYFGSWHLPYEIPENLKLDIIKSKYIWFSHGHPDHINQDSLHLFKNNNILVSEHFGSRIYTDLKLEGFKISILKDREWKHLSKNISIMSISTKTQDTILLLRCNNDIFINLNDAGLYSSKFIKKTISKFRRKFLLSISSFEADMLNFFDHNNKFITPAIADKFSAGEYLSMLADVIGAKYIIPFSTFHEYQRDDSIWVNKYIYPINKAHEGISKKHVFVKPFSFINTNKDDDILTQNIRKKILEVKSSKDFGDDWTDGDTPEYLGRKTWIWETQTLDVTPGTTMSFRPEIFIKYAPEPLPGKDPAPPASYPANFARVQFWVGSVAGNTAPSEDTNSDLPAVFEIIELPAELTYNSTSPGTYPAGMLSSESEGGYDTGDPVSSDDY